MTDGQTDESDFIGRCPTSVERPKIYVFFFTSIFKALDNLMKVFRRPS